MVLMASGAVLAEVYSNKATIDLDYTDLQLLFSRWIAILYIVVGFTIYIAMLLMSREVIIRGLVNKGMVGKFPLLVFGTFTGYQSGITGLCLKSTVELIKTQIMGHHNFDSHPMAIIFPVAALVSVFIHVCLLNAGLKYYDALQMVPIMQSSLIIYNILTGGIVLNEFTQFSRISSICFMIGSFLCVVGILILLLKPAVVEEGVCGKGSES